jgi:hypothetical protein
MENLTNDSVPSRPRVRAFCCDPFVSHPVRKVKGLRDISQLIMTLHPSLKFKAGDKLCSPCRKIVANLPADSADLVSTDDSSSVPEDFHPDSSAVDADVYELPDHQLVVLNQSLQVLGESPVCKRKAENRVNYAKKKVKAIESTIKKKLELSGVSIDASDSALNKADISSSEIIDQLKEKFKSCSKISEKVQVLTILPKSWSAKRIEEEFRATNYMVRKAKKLVEVKGILSTPDQKAGKTLSKNTVDVVRSFYCSEMISRLMPGMKDYVSVMNVEDGQRQHIQKRLVLCNLKEAFESFKESYPLHKIGFSTFAELRPKECVLAGASGTHAVCVCTIHQNLKLMFQGAKLEKVGDRYSYHNCLAEILCNPARVQCFLGSCTECPGTEQLQNRLEQHLDEQMIERIEYKQWTTTDRATLETKVQSVDEFLRIFIEVLPSVVQHDFIASEQTKYLQRSRRMLKSGEFLVVGDFSENYSFVLQDAAQSFHWNNLQATLHPFVCYYNCDEGDACNRDEGDDQSTIDHLSFVVISESNSHDTIAVHLFQRVLIEFLTNTIMKPTKILYFSDGCAAQYKNRKNFANLCHHEDDFGMPAEWHFFATSHGKGPCDGVGGTVKRLAARASLQRPYESQILTPKQLFEFGCSQIPGIKFHYTTAEDYERELTILGKRFEQTRTIPGTHRLHSFVPISREELEVRDFSSCTKMRVERISLTRATSTDCSMNIAAIMGYVTARYDGSWWLACIMKTMPDSGEVEVSFLHPHGPARSFKFPPDGDVLVMSSQDILTVVHPLTPTGRTYTLTLTEMTEASAAMDKN